MFDGGINHPAGNRVTSPLIVIPFLATKERVPALARDRFRPRPATIALASVSFHFASFTSKCELRRSCLKPV